MQGIEPVALSPSWEWETRLIERHIRQKYEAAVGVPLQILEAGCGQQWYLNLKEIQYVLTGVDLDRAALEIRKNVLNDLDEIVEGDLRDVVLADERFDVIYNAYVLEHIEGAEAVLKSFVRWLRPGGLIIIRIPDPDSVQGFVTRISPHWFHVLYYRYALGKKAAGTPGHAPYRTYYDPVVSRQGLHGFCRENHLLIKAEYGNGYWQPGHGLARHVIHFAKRVIGLFSFGMLSWRHTDLLYVLQKE